jgi:enamine deaminase RidA (YjgF/YER057c/UK114 family)
LPPFCASQGVFFSNPKLASFKCNCLDRATQPKKNSFRACYIQMQMTAVSTPEKNLAALGLASPQLPAPGGNYVSAKRAGAVVYLAGVISTGPDGVITGTVGVDRSIDEGYAAAAACALTQLAVLKRELGSLNLIAEVLTVNGYVNAAPGFADSPAVINGASDLLVRVFGEAGRHVRAAVGVSALPRNALVELQMTVRITES